VDLNFDRSVGLRGESGNGLQDGFDLLFAGIAALSC